MCRTCPVCIAERSHPHYTSAVTKKVVLPAAATVAVSVAATAAAVTTATAAVAAATTAPWALFALTRLVDVQRAATIVAAVQSVDSLRCVFAGHFHEPKTARPTGFTVSRQHHRKHFAVLGEELPHVILPRAERKVAYIDPLIQEHTPRRPCRQQARLCVASPVDSQARLRTLGWKRPGTSTERAGDCPDSPPILHLAMCKCAEERRTPAVGHRLEAAQISHAQTLRN
jgi:hypothetical protein